MEVERAGGQTGGPAAGEAAPRPHSILRNTLATLAVQLTSAAFTAGLTLYLVRALGPGTFGLFSLALAIAALLTLPSDFGLSASAGRYVAERRREPGAVARIVLDALRLKLLLAAAVSVLLALLAGPIADAYGKPALAWPLRGTALALFGQSVLLLAGAVFVSLGRATSNLRLTVVESATETTASVALVLAGAGASGAAFGRAIGYGVGAALGVAMLLRLAPRARAAGHARRTRELARYAGRLAAVDWVQTFYAQLDVLLIGALLTNAAVGLFQGPMRLVAFLGYAGLALAGGVAPRLARGGSEPPNAAALATSLRFLLVLQTALAVPLAVWATPLVHVVLGEGYGGSADVLRAVAPYVWLAGLAPLLSLSANYLGAAGRRLPIALVTLGANLALDLALIPTIGVVGAAIGTDVAFAIYVPAHLWLCAREVELPLRRIGLTALRALAAGGALAAVLTAAGTQTLSTASWVWGTAGGLAAFALVLAATGEARPADLRAALERVRR